MAPNRPSGKGTAKDPSALLADAETQFEVGNLDNAISIALKALETTGDGGDFELRALNLLGILHLEAGEVDDAREYLLRAVKLDNEGTMDEDVGGGPEKFLFLAQLSEEGGNDSVQWFERGAAALRKQIQAISESPIKAPAHEAVLLEKQQKLGGVLCAVAEVYMTDLSWEADAEQRCETLITEAMLIAPGSPETWQTVANVRISQERVDEAKGALKRSLELWQDLAPEHPAVPEFATRIGLCRLLVEVGMEEEAIAVLQRLVLEDDTSVEAWYLGGWSLFTLGEKLRTENKKDEFKSSWTTSRWWLANCMKLYEIQEYEDDRLGTHAIELVEAINKELGPPPDNLLEAGPGSDDEDEDDSDEDEEMKH